MDHENEAFCNIKIEKKSENKVGPFVIDNRCQYKNLLVIF